MTSYFRDSRDDPRSVLKTQVDCLNHQPFTCDHLPLFVVTIKHSLLACFAVGRVVEVEVVLTIIYQVVRSFFIRLRPPISQSLATAKFCDSIPSCPQIGYHGLALQVRLYPRQHRIACIDRFPSMAGKALCVTFGKEILTHPRFENTCTSSTKLKNHESHKKSE
jgi:hypothetical protein